jgi:hypothetical protein
MSGVRALGRTLQEDMRGGFGPEWDEGRALSAHDLVETGEVRYNGAS